ncbi:MAG: hypothetical protein WA622_29855 [Mycobacterium sp.]|uniref:hypothetical protein n=1 Tax=Mycobacterium sp. TaxID=1785 RepID=UPI003CA4FFC7
MNDESPNEEQETLRQGIGALGREMKLYPDRYTARAAASRCCAVDCLTHKGLGVGTEMPLDGDGTMVEVKVTIAPASSAQTKG